jgi:hypothetical protein
MALVVVVGTTTLAGCAQPPSHPASATRPTSVVATVNPSEPVEGMAAFDAAEEGPTTVVDGAPMGYRHDRAGAVAAAVAYARLNEDLVLMSMGEAMAARRAMGSERAAGVLADNIASELGEFREAWPVGELTYRVAPMAVRVEEASPEVMRVDVWFVGVVEGRNLAAYEEWITETYRLVWERDDWRVDALSETSGPRPDVGHQEPASPAEISALLDGFEPVP